MVYFLAHFLRKKKEKDKARQVHIPILCFILSFDDRKVFNKEVAKQT